MNEVQFVYANTGNSIIADTPDYGVEQFLDYSGDDMPTNIKELLCQLQKHCQQYEHIFSVLARKTPYVVFMAKQDNRVRLVIPAQVHLNDENFRIEGKVVHELDTLLKDPDNMSWEIFVGDDVGENTLHRLDQQEIRSVCECLYSDEEKQNTFLLFRQRYGTSVVEKNRSYLLLVCMFTVVFLTVAVYLQRDKIFILSQSSFQQRLYKGNLTLQTPPRTKLQIQKLQVVMERIEKHLTNLTKEQQVQTQILEEQIQKLEDISTAIKKEYAAKALYEYKLKELEKERQKQNFLKKLMTVFSKKIKQQKKKIADSENNIRSQEAQKKVMTDHIAKQKKQTAELSVRKKTYISLLQMCEKIHVYFEDKMQGAFAIDLPSLGIELQTFAPHIDGQLLHKEDEENLQNILRYVKRINVKKLAWSFQKRAMENDVFSRFILSVIDEKPYVDKEEFPQLEKMFSQKQALDKLMTFYGNIENKNNFQRDQEKND
ncbi:hypothetical protein [Candidatus Uabimicrobium amorphum]|nr:hypothetical protein [Candidatus Uabimicrobium amorphum]